MGYRSAGAMDNISVGASPRPCRWARELVVETERVSNHSDRQQIARRHGKHFCRWVVAVPACVRVLAGETTRIWGAPESTEDPCLGSN